MERCPGEWWVINDRARMAGVCLWLTWFDPKCLVTMAIGQSCSLWTAVRIPGAIRWSAWWAWVNGEVGEEEEVQNEGSNGYNYTQQQREVLVLPLLHDLRALGPPPPYLVHWFPKRRPTFASGGHYHSATLHNTKVNRKLSAQIWIAWDCWVTRTGIHQQPVRPGDATHDPL